MRGSLFLVRLPARGLVRPPPATIFAVHTPILFFPCDGRRSLHAKNLVHGLPGRDIVTGKPAFAVHRTGVLVSAPIRIFGWVYFYCPGHAHSFLKCGLSWYNGVASSIPYSGEDYQPRPEGLRDTASHLRVQTVPHRERKRTRTRPAFLRVITCALRAHAHTRFCPLTAPQ